MGSSVVKQGVDMYWTTKDTEAYNNLRLSAYGDQYNPQREEDSFSKKAWNYAKGVGSGMIVGGALGALGGRFSGAGTKLATEGKALSKTLKGQKEILEKHKGEVGAAVLKYKSSKAVIKNRQAIESGKAESIVVPPTPEKKGFFDSLKGKPKTSNDVVVKPDAPFSPKDQFIKDRSDVEENLKSLQGRGAEYKKAKANVKGTSATKRTTDAEYKKHMTGYAGYGAVGGGVLGAGGAAMANASDDDRRRRQQQYDEAMANPRQQFSRPGPAQKHALAMAKAIGERKRALASGNVKFHDNNYKFISSEQLIQLDNAIDNVAILSRRFKRNKEDNSSKEINRPMRIKR